MTPPDWNQLLSLAPYPSDGYARLADRLGAILKTKHDVLLVQAEAVVALEAAATSIASPAIHALNIVTSTYGGWFGEWLARGGADVTDLAAEPGRPIEISQVVALLADRPEINLIAGVHAESATGIVNPLEAIAELAKDRDALLVVDAVASVGGHALDVDALGIDLVAIGPQKSLGGPAGVSALAVGPRAWRQIEGSDAPVRSVLALLDLKRSWLDTGRDTLPGMPSGVEFYLLEAALDAVEREELDQVVARHARAAQRTRDGLRAMGLQPWVPDAQASNLVTCLAVPPGAMTRMIAAAERVGCDISPAPGDLAQALIRLNHTGRNATPQRVDAMLAVVAKTIS